MGTQFLWFYDVIAVAAVLVFAFLSARKNIMRSLATFAAFLLSFIIAVSFSGGMAKSFYNGSVKQSNASKLRKTLTDVDFTSEMQTYLESLDYGLRLKTENIEAIFNSGADIDSQMYKYVTDSKGRKFTEEEQFLTRLHEGYAQVMSKAVSENLNAYSAAFTAESIENAPEKFEALIPLLMDIEDKQPAADYIAENYVAEPYTDIIRLVALTVLFLIMLMILLFVSKAFGRNSMGSPTIGFRVIGGILGILNGGIALFVIAVMVRLYVILGDEKMLFFNFEAIDNTYIFKYIYDMILSL